MKINLDLFRDTLFAIEKLLTIDVDHYVQSNTLDSNEVLEHLESTKKKNNIEAADFWYSLKMLSDAGFINSCVEVGADGIWAIDAIFDITFPGHEFLECVRKETTWNKTKDIAKKVGSGSIQVLTQIATGVATNMITAQLLP